MSSALALASVTAVLRNLLDNAVVDGTVTSAVGGRVTVGTLAPDRVPIGTEETAQLNLFLYRIAPNVGWRNEQLPSRDQRGERRTNPPLALDLFYLLTAYGKNDFEAEILLGYAMQMLHETPVLTREMIRRTFTPGTPLPGDVLPPAVGALSGSDLADQIEQIKLTPHPMDVEEMSHLWSALQAHYRPSAAYHVSVVLIESLHPARSPLPVLMRGAGDIGVRVQPSLAPPFPTLTEVVPPDEQPSAELADTLTLRGHNLSGSTVVALARTPRRTSPFELAPLAGATDTELAVRLEVNAATDAVQWPIGFYTLAVRVGRTGEPDRTTNELGFALAPRVDTITVGTTTHDAAGNAAFGVTVTCTPQVRPEQRAAFILGDREATASARTTQTDTLTFSFRGVPPGTYVARLRVDGVESRFINRLASPPAFEPGTMVSIA